MIPPPRLGPRPLPLHLGTALSGWTSCEAAWPLLRRESAHSKAGEGADPFAALLAEIDAVARGAPTGTFERALKREIARRMDRLAAGVLAYRQHKVRRTLAEPPVVWSEGGTRLLDYGATDRSARRRGARAVLVVPSLINRWQVLDLAPGKSLLRAMAASGLRPYLVDWGDPGAIERGYDAAGYVGRLERALSFVARRARRAPAVMGYCMGGTLAVGLAARRPRGVAALALLAAPWDFHADRTGQAFLVSSGPLLARLAQQLGELPLDVLNTLFWSLDPWLAEKKFARFAGMDPESDAARDFVLLEDWLNEGPALAGPTARDCLIDWYGANLPGAGDWTVAKTRVTPAKLKMPALVLIPSGDRIVPPESAAALTEPGRGLANATRRDLPLGHIGMVVSGRARDLCWEPLIAWLQENPVRRARA